MTQPPANGACIGKPTNWWFPSASNRSSSDDRRDAREGAKKAITICNSCPVQDECLAYSLEWEPVGIWGGLPENDRDRMRRRLGIKIVRPLLSDLLGYPSRV
jgi:hypothetical protein